MTLPTAKARRIPLIAFERVVEDWLKRDQAKNKQSSFYQVTRSVESDLLPAWRGKSVDKITKRDVVELLDLITDRGAPVMARRVQAYVNRFFAWCIERDILKVDPTAGMPRIGKAVSRERVLTDEELTKVWRGADAIGLFGMVDSIADLYRGKARGNYSASMVRNPRRLHRAAKRQNENRQRPRHSPVGTG